jgi:hypothetical protein
MDALAWAEIVDTLEDPRLPEGCVVPGVSLPTSPVVVLGSPRYNLLADDFQRQIEAPFQFISLTPGRPPDQAILSISADTGQEYVCSFDPVLGEIERSTPPPLSEEENDYGILLVGDDERYGGRRIVWAGGIHGVGTLGSVKWLLDNWTRYDWAELGRACFLVRVCFSPSERHDRSLAESLHAELVRGPCPWTLRPKRDFPIGLLCDLGGVLVVFERKRLRFNFRHLLGVELTPEGATAIEELRLPFEAGEMAPVEFLSRLGDILRVRDQEAQLRAAWCDIFSRQQQTIAFLERLARSEDVKLILVSNTDPLRAEYTLSRLGLSSLFQPEQVVASYQSDVSAKGVDDSMLRKALGILREQFHGRPFLPLFVDDVRAYTRLAGEAGLGIVGIHYRSYAQFVCELRQQGLYLSMTALGL